MTYLCVSWYLVVLCEKLLRDQTLSGTPCILYTTLPTCQLWLIMCGGIKIPEQNTVEYYHIIPGYSILYLLNSNSTILSFVLTSSNTGYIILTSITRKLLANKEIFIQALVNYKDTAGLVVYNEWMKAWLKAVHNNNNDCNNITVPINQATTEKLVTTRK